MKIKLLFVLLIGFVPSLIFSQKNDISLGGLYIPTGYGDRVLCTNLSYFRNFSSKSLIGITVDIDQYFEKYDEYYANKYGEKDYSSIISLIYKNNFYSKGRSSFYYGAGITFGSLITYYEIIPEKRGFCGVGLPENWKPPVTKPLNHWNYKYSSGITTMFGYQYRVVDNFYIGASLKGVLMYFFDDNTFFPGILPLIKIGYKW